MNSGTRRMISVLSAFSKMVSLHLRFLHAVRPVIFLIFFFFFFLLRPHPPSVMFHWLVRAIWADGVQWVWRMESTTWCPFDMLHDIWNWPTPHELLMHPAIFKSGLQNYYRGFLSVLSLSLLGPDLKERPKYWCNYRTQVKAALCCLRDFGEPAFRNPPDRINCVKKLNDMMDRNGSAIRPQPSGIDLGHIS